MGCGGSTEEQGNPFVKTTFPFSNSLEKTVHDVNNNWPRGRVSPAKSNFKVVFLGKSGVFDAFFWLFLKCNNFQVGKTSITLRFCRDTFQVGTEATIGYVIAFVFQT